MAKISCVLIGNANLLVQCGEALLARGGAIACVVTREADIASWAQKKGIAVEAPGADLATRLVPLGHDWILSIANLDMLADKVLASAACGAINFHDGPLPAYAGLNAPVWALLAGERRYGISWHMISGAVDTGDIIAQESFDIAPDETALTLNTKCFSAAIEGFDRVLDNILVGKLPLEAQDLSQRSYFGRDKRPAAFGRLDFGQPAVALAQIVRALDHGSYWNPLTLAKFEAAGKVWLVTQATLEAGTEPGTEPAEPGTVLDIRADQFLVATGDGALLLSGLKTATGTPVEVADFVQIGDVLPSSSTPETRELDALAAALAPSDGFWRKRLAMLQPARLALAVPGASGETVMRDVAQPRGPRGLENEALLAALAGFATRLAEAACSDLAYCDADLTKLARKGYCVGWLPLRFDAGDAGFDKAREAFTQGLHKAQKMRGFACDLPARAPETTGLHVPDIGLIPAGGDLIQGTALTFEAGAESVVIHADSGRITADYLDLLEARLALFLSEIARDASHPLKDIPLLPEAERELILNTWNTRTAPTDGPGLIHTAFEAQVAKTPEATALVFEAQELSYTDLNAAANKAAHVLASMGVTPGMAVALHINRGPNMLIGALAIMKAGGAYMPLDPAFPEARLAHYLQDSGAQVIVTEAALASTLPGNAARLNLDDDTRLARAPESNPESGVSGADLAYVIYTSGSTGVPKGVMVEHRNVASFFTGMDARIKHEAGDTWLAVTSLSFDISVLELFWTLARGFKLVLASDSARSLQTTASGALIRSDRQMDFSLFFWGNDDGPGPKKYQLLLDGARFADANGFRAIWTPERHFHAFGGPYPNPAVTGAAVAAVTRRLDVRAGSCVTPLHHPARIAEEWSVIDNLTDGRAGIGFAAGWQPNDFVLRPENAPPNNKKAMFESIDTLRRLWRGEAVEFALADGSKQAVVTQPRPVSKELPVWVTTAGNPETWREAGAIGANVLTHLLGQSIAEVGGKIEIYHEALRQAGHDPADFTVTLMLHTYLAESREQARETARGPMKDYLRSAAGLIKQFAWAFPAFKRPKGVSNAFELDLGVLGEDELEEILDFAFQRYFEDSGLFGTIEDALARTEQLKRIGVDEIACLIDYGIAPETVLSGLKPLADVVTRANEDVLLAEDDFSLAAQIRRHHVTHMQMTPSMAQIITMDEAVRGALARVSHLFIGGEALPGALVRDLKRATSASIENMYGPTETTIWSATGPATPGSGTISIGRPIAGTRLYVLDAQGAPLPVGMAGELYIGGAGVARGYLNRDEANAAAFLPNPFAGEGTRLYRSGDLVRQCADGSFDFIGRADHQVKLRGYRIELGEIEARLAALAGPGLHVVVLVREDVPGDARLVAYLAGPGQLDEKALRAGLAKNLPAYMIPTHFVRLDAMPLTPNKKIDRLALPAPNTAGQKGNVVEAFTAPTSQIEAQIGEIWSHILGVARIGANDNFFELGGHSLLAVQAHRKIKAALNLPRLSITDIFRYPTLKALAGMLTEDVSPPKTNNKDRADTRADAMSRRRAMRAGRRR